MAGVVTSITVSNGIIPTGGISGVAVGANVSKVFGVNAAGVLGWYDAAGVGGGGFTYTDEQAQDAVGGILTDTATVDFTYNDAAGTITADVINDSITDAKLRNGAATSVIGRSANSTGDPADIAATADGQYLARRSGALTWAVIAAADVPSLDAAKITTGTLPEARGGTNQSTYTLGDVLYASAANTLAKLAGNTTATQKFLAQTGSGAASAAPGWVALAAADIPSLDTSKLTTGQLGPARGGSGADLSATGGANQFVRQSTAGGAFTVSVIAAADVPALDTSKLTTGTLPSTRGGTDNASYAKGDVLAASSATTLAKVAVSATDGDVLSADSTAAAGVSYQHPALQLFAYRVPGSLSRAGNRWHGPARLTPVTPGAAVAAAANKLYAYPLFVPQGQTIYQVAVKQAAFSIGGSFRVGVYTAASLTDPWPLALLWDSGSQSTGGGTLANMLAFTANLATVRGGLYWLVFVSDNATATYEPVSPAGVFPLFGTPFAGGSTGGCVRADFTYAALPSYFPTANRTVLGAADGDLPGVFVQFKSPYLLYETFSDVDTTALTAHVMDYGGGWTNQAGTWTISGGKAVQSDTTGGIKVITVNAGTGDGTLEVDIPTPASTDFTVGVPLRFLDLNNWWRVVGSTATGNWRLIEHTASAGGTVRATYAVSPTINTTHHVKAVLAGTSISVYIDGVLALSFTSSAQQSNTLFGLYESRSAGLQANSFDVFKVY